MTEHQVLQQGVYLQQREKQDGSGVGNKCNMWNEGWQAYLGDLLGVGLHAGGINLLIGQLLHSLRQP